MYLLLKLNMRHVFLREYNVKEICIEAASPRLSNTKQAAGVSRRHFKHFTNSQNIKIVEFGDHIWNHREKSIEISTNMPGIGSLIRKIDVQN